MEGATMVENSWIAFRGSKTNEWMVHENVAKNSAKSCIGRGGTKEGMQHRNVAKSHKRGQKWSKGLFLLGQGNSCVAYHFSRNVARFGGGFWRQVRRDGVLKGQ
jgi:hypothetical protein